MDGYASGASEVLEPVWDIVAHLKDVASIVTPIMIVLLGLRINSSIQTQNRIAERESGFVKHWADKFSGIAENIDAAATGVFRIYYRAANQGQLGEYRGDVMADVRNLAADLEEYRIILENFVALSPKTGGDLRRSFGELQNTCADWFRNRGGDVQGLQRAQAGFNQCARKTHRELLQLED